MYIARKCGRSTCGVVGIAAALMLAAAPLSAQAPLSPEQIDEAFNDIFGGGGNSETTRPQGEHGGPQGEQGENRPDGEGGGGEHSSSTQDDDDLHNPCRYEWEATHAEEFCSGVTLTYTDPDSCRVQASCSVTGYVYQADGRQPNENTTWTASLDVETTVNGTQYIELCFVPDAETQTYSMEARHTRDFCGTDQEALSMHMTYGYFGGLPYIMQSCEVSAPPCFNAPSN